MMGMRPLNNGEGLLNDNFRWLSEDGICSFNDDNQIISRQNWILYYKTNDMLVSHGTHSLVKTAFSLSGPQQTVVFCMHFFQSVY